MADHNSMAENPEISSPSEWSEQQLLAFLLIHAADADGEIHKLERRLISNGLGKDIYTAMLNEYRDMNAEQRTARLETLKSAHLQSQDSRIRLQSLLKRVFLADGEYSPSEQALTARISDWLRED